MQANVDKLPLRELLTLQSKLEKAIPEAKARERAEVISDMRKLAEKRGFSDLRDIFGVKMGHKGRSARYKYVNPENRNQTWTGMGRKPNWLNDKLAKGADIANFRVA